MKERSNHRLTQLAKRISVITAFMLIGITMLTMLGCLTLKTVSQEDAYRTGRLIATTYYLSEENMSEDAAKAVRYAWIIFDAAVSQEPTSNDALRALLLTGLQKSDMPPAYVPLTSELLFAAMTDAVNRMGAMETEGQRFTEQLHGLHRGLSEAIAVHKRYSSAMPPAWKVTAD